MQSGICWAGLIGTGNYDYDCLISVHGACTPLIRLRDISYTEIVELYNIPHTHRNKWDVV